MENISPDVAPGGEVIPWGPPPKDTINVSPDADATKLGLQISNAVVAAGEQVPALLTVSRTSIHQAVRGIAVASPDHMKNSGKQLYFQPAFQTVSRATPLMCLYLSTKPVADTAADTADSTLAPKVKVARKCRIISVAGAIASRIREDKRVVVSAVGADAVGGAILALGNVRVFLQRDNLDIKVQAEFEQPEKDGKERHAMQFMVTVAEEEHA